MSVPTDAPNAPVVEIGYQVAVPGYQWWQYENETTAELQWPQSVYVYDQMRRTDGQCKSVLNAVTLPVLRTPWRVDPSGARDEVVQLVADDLGLPIVGRQQSNQPVRQKDRFSWVEHLRLALIMLPIGHSYFEQVYRVTDDGSRAHLRKLAYRPPTTIEQIDVAPDGGLISIKQYRTQQQDSPKPITVDRLVGYIFDREGGNWLGTSILRPVYKNWLLKDRLLRVWAQTIERNGMGIPVYEAAETEASLAAGMAMATKLRAGEAAGAATPFGAKLRLMGVEGTLPDAKPAVEYHDQQIARAVLAHFLNLGQQTGSWALGSTFADFFTLSLQTLAQQVADTATQHVIEDLVDINWGPDEPAPRLVFDEIGSRQAATAEAMKSLVDAGILHPDAVLEGAARQYYGLPPADPATATAPPGGAPSATQPQGQTPTGTYSVAASAALSDEAAWIAAAAGVDTHPGGERLKRMWVYGELASKWVTWTDLYDHLKKYIKNRVLLRKTVSKWYRLRYGHNPPRHSGAVRASSPAASPEAIEAFAAELAELDQADFDDLADSADVDADDEAEEWQERIDALCAALDELSGAVVAKFNPDLHPRNPKGGPGGGRFRSTVDRLKDALTEHRNGGGKGDPFEGFDREQLRRAAVKQGIKLDRKESRDSIASKLAGDLGGPKATGPKPDEAKPKRPRAPRKPKTRTSSDPAPQQPSREATLSPWGMTQEDLDEAEARAREADRKKAERRAQIAAEVSKNPPKGVRTGEDARTGTPLSLAGLESAGDPRASSLRDRVGDSGFINQRAAFEEGGDPAADPRVRAIDSIMSDSRVAEPILVYRGIEDDGSILPSGHAVGAQFTDRAFSSTSTDPQVAAGFGLTQLRVHVPAGVGAVRMADDGDSSAPYEAEVLLDRGLVYTVTGDRRVGDLRIVDVTASYPGGKADAAVDAPGGSRPKAPKKAGKGIDEILTGDPDGEVVDEDLAEIKERLNGTYAGFEVQVKRLRTTGRTIDFEATILDGAGRPVGKTKRQFHRDDDGTLWVQHDLLQLDEHVQGQGFAQAWNAHLTEWYQQSGVSYVATQADIDVGGYTWARHGFDFASDDARRDWIFQGRMKLDAFRDEPATSAWGGVMPSRRDYILDAFPGLTEQEVDEQIAAMESLLDRMDAGEPVSAYEISQLGRKPGMSRDDAWIGKHTMLGTDWEGVKWLTPAPQKNK